MSPDSIRDQLRKDRPVMPDDVFARIRETITLEAGTREDTQYCAKPGRTTPPRFDKSTSREDATTFNK